jgi:hypothetical protein
MEQLLHHRETFAGASFLLGQEIGAHCLLSFQVDRVPSKCQYVANKRRGGEELVVSAMIR